ncbi:ABC-2 type transport system permease protein [Nonlabens dokdonensis]|uniref:ABC-2 type transport system permease protein n=2 Tax=Nonlabens dokdonensis TaxID=328515 RepID=A0ABX5Q0B8_9FLAO|nr:M1 family aminopeptidase [Nonlabens dokdonensis]AGC75627.1 putative membrane protein [Nonlabens dokdonensis DSW-6]PZX43319.1 ABC-2 type transport system permease protein [Nonlabens dokdonensis]
MFSTIYIHEVKTWFKKPLFYIYAGVLFALSLLLSATAVGVFDSDNVTVTSAIKLNGAVGIYGLLGLFAVLTYLLIPSIIGGTIQRDFKNNMHNVLYSYPLTKWNYLLAKFSAGFTMTLLVIIASLLGLTLGFYLPGANEELVGPFKIMNYLQPFLLYIIPNVFFYGAIVFAITAFLRNINIGFMFVLVMVILQFAAQSSVTTMDDPYWVELMEPTGDSATYAQIKYWTPEEQSTQLIPIEGTLLYNRLIWLGIALIVFFSILFAFNFSQNPSSISLAKKKSQRVTKRNFGTITKVVMPPATQDTSFLGQLKTAWVIAKSDISYIVKGWPFIIIATVAFAFSLLTMLITGQQYGTDILPKTWVMLQFAGGIFSTFAYLLIYLYTGLIMDRAKAAHIHQLIDATPTKNWTMLLSKFIAMIVMVATLLLIVILSGMIIQAYNGFFEFELPLYLFDLYVINIWDFIPWILMSILIHTLIKNKWLGLITLLVLALGIPPLLNAIGVEQSQFVFNQGAGSPSPSDMNGYGSGLARYFTYRLYWILLGIALFALSVLFYRRGMGTNISERFAFAKARLSKSLVSIMAISLVGFFAIGGYIWKVNNIDNEPISGKEQEELRVNYEKELSKYSKVPQPRLVAVNTFMDIFPDTRDFKAGATYTLINQTEFAIDTLHVNYPDRPTEINLDRETDIVYDQEDYDYRMYEFRSPLQPGDTLIMKFTTQNEPNTFFENNSPVVDNGTFIDNFIFPSIGYNEQGEIRNTQVRLKYGLPPKDRLPYPDAPGARDNNYIGGNSDWIDFEATVSTSSDQIAIAPGYLIKEWEKDGRKYFNYKMDSKIVNFYAFLSGRYEVKREEHEGVKLEIYYHPDHVYNVDRMMNGLKDGLDYYNKNYTPYQHRQARIIEFPRTGGGFAQAFPNTIPFSEAIGFIADVDTENNEGVDYPFSVTAHELAHQWWAHQVIGANAKGATLLSESLSEYSSLKVLEKTNGKEQMRRFLKDAMDGYLLGRTVEQIKENPLMYNENQQYIHYQKGSLVLYAMSDYLGEKKFNDVVKRFAEKYQFKGAPYPVATEFVDDIRAVTPDSLQYLVNDMFETITLYDNSARKGTYRELPNGKYLVTLDARVIKYRSDEKGKSVYKNRAGDSISFTPKDRKRALQSLPLADYIEVGVFGEENEETGVNKVLYLKKLKVTDIPNSFDIVVDSKPVEAGIDPFNKLIDRNSDDNRIALSENTSANKED